MKFKDIPKYTRIGSYQVNISLESLLDQLDHYNDNDGLSNLQLNPDFQRGHVWTKAQQVAFVEYLLKGGKAHRTIYFNHPNWMGSFMGDFVCVDGLQRITACIQFLKNEIKVFGCYYKDFEDKLHSNVDLLFNINNLKTKKEVLQWYIEMNTGGTVHSKEQINKVKKLLEKENNDNV